MAAAVAVAAAAANAPQAPHPQEDYTNVVLSAPPLWYQPHLAELVHKWADPEAPPPSPPWDELPHEILTEIYYYTVNFQAVLEDDNVSVAMRVIGVADFAGTCRTFAAVARDATRPYRDMLRLCCSFFEKNPVTVPMQWVHQHEPRAMLIAACRYAVDPKLRRGEVNGFRAALRAYLHLLRATHDGTRTPADVRLAALAIAHKSLDYPVQYPRRPRRSSSKEEEPRLNYCRVFNGTRPEEVEGIVEALVKPTGKTKEELERNAALSLHRATQTADFWEWVGARASGGLAGALYIALQNGCFPTKNRRVPKKALPKVDAVVTRLLGRLDEREDALAVLRVSQTPLALATKDTVYRRGKEEGREYHGLQRTVNALVNTFGRPPTPIENVRLLLDMAPFNAFDALDPNYPYCTSRPLANAACHNWPAFRLLVHELGRRADLNINRLPYMVWQGGKDQGVPVEEIEWRFMELWLHGYSGTHPREAVEAIPCVARDVSVARRLERISELTDIAPEHAPPCGAHIGQCDRATRFPPVGSKRVLDGDDDDDDDEEDGRVAKFARVEE
jgi:hypothetical protein